MFIIIRIKVRKIKCVTLYLYTHILCFFQIEDKHVLVIGSILPWIEAILLHLGAKKVTTLEYGQVKNEHPKLNPITPDQLK